MINISVHNIKDKAFIDPYNNLSFITKQYLD